MTAWLQAEAHELAQLAADAKQDSDMLRLVAEEQQQLSSQVGRVMHPGHEIPGHMQLSLCTQLCHIGTDPDPGPMGIQAELLQQSLLASLVPVDEADQRGAVLEVRAGTGGEEAALFAADLLRMYEAHCKDQGWRCEVCSGPPHVARRTSAAQSWHALAVGVVQHSAALMCPS